jgi:hypothetical protein
MHVGAHAAPALPMHRHFDLGGRLQIDALRKRLKPGAWRSVGWPQPLARVVAVHFHCQGRVLIPDK